MKSLSALALLLCIALAGNPILIGNATAQPAHDTQTATMETGAATPSSSQVQNAPEGARVPGTRTQKGPDADWVPIAALGFMVFFFVCLFTLKALKSRSEKPSKGSEAKPASD